MLYGEFLVLLLCIVAGFFLLTKFVPDFLLWLGRQILRRNNRVARWYLNRQYHKAYTYNKNYDTGFFD